MIENTSITITIDGPSSSGKSTLGEQLAHNIGYHFLDTGCLYRALTVATLQRNIPITDTHAIIKLASDIDIVVQTSAVEDVRQYTVLIDEIDITWELRSSRTDSNVSLISTIPEVRHLLTEQMRSIADGVNIVMIGRDIGTVVAPEAPLKFYLDASIDERARRRHNENMQSGQESDYKEILTNLQTRDDIDTRRDNAPLRKPINAYTIDTTTMKPTKVLIEMLRIFHTVI
ncbi:MAG: cytidylate kinase [Anaerolineaceae bacterium]|nr:cytidylate kinase [Anaerolineaceae bacterium]|tara:strand:- start:24497 stop:25186 length:690 start_codon:yes stop_codon:yes gene_type:complete